MIRLFLFTVLLFVSLFSFSQKMWAGYEHLMSPVKNYVIYKAGSKITIDGKADETAWQQAEWTDLFVNIKGKTEPEPEYKTRAKMLWDNNYLYIFAELEEPHIWTFYDDNSREIFNDNNFEIFIDPDCDTHNYFEFKIDAQNKTSVKYLLKPKRNGGEMLQNWVFKGLKSKVFIDGTLNNAKDIDKKWTVEVAIPFRYLTDYKKYIMPKDKSHWKVNLTREQWYTNIVYDNYVKATDKVTRKPLKEQFWVWSPHGVTDRHYPERWGLVQFSAKTVGTEKVNFILPAEEKFAKYLWFIYYKEQEYRARTGNYAPTLSAMGLHQSTRTNEGDYILYNLYVNGHIFRVTLKTERGLKLSVNQDGFFEVLEK